MINKLLLFYYLLWILLYASVIFMAEDVPILSAPASIIFKQVSKSRIPPAAFTFTVSLTMLFMSFTSSTVAPPVPKPVEVLMKSGFTSSAISHNLIFSSSVR